MSVPLRGCLVFVSKQGTDAITYKLPKEKSLITAGSGIVCDVRFIHSKVLDKHFIIYRNARAEIKIANLSKSNPVAVNGEVVAKKQTLKSGDIIQLLEYKMRWMSKPAKRKGSWPTEEEKKKISDGLITKRRVTIHSNMYTGSLKLENEEVFQDNVTLVKASVDKTPAKPSTPKHEISRNKENGSAMEQNLLDLSGTLLTSYSPAQSSPYKIRTTSRSTPERIATPVKNVLGESSSNSATDAVTPRAYGKKSMYLIDFTTPAPVDLDMATTPVASRPQQSSSKKATVPRTEKTLLRSVLKNSAMKNAESNVNRKALFLESSAVDISESTDESSIINVSSEADNTVLQADEKNEAEGVNVTTDFTGLAELVKTPRKDQESDVAMENSDDEEIRDLLDSISSALDDKDVAQISDLSAEKQETSENVTDNFEGSHPADSTQSERASIFDRNSLSTAETSKFSSPAVSQIDGKEDDERVKTRGKQILNWIEDVRKNKESEPNQTEQVMSARYSNVTPNESFASTPAAYDASTPKLSILDTVAHLNMSHANLNKAKLTVSPVTRLSLINNAVIMEKYQLNTEMPRSLRSTRKQFGNAMASLNNASQVFDDSFDTNETLSSLQTPKDIDMNQSKPENRDILSLDNLQSAPQHCLSMNAIEFVKEKDDDEEEVDDIFEISDIVEANDEESQTDNSEDEEEMTETKLEPNVEESQVYESEDKVLKPQLKNSDAMKFRLNQQDLEEGVLPLDDSRNDDAEVVNMSQQETMAEPNGEVQPDAQVLNNHNGLETTADHLEDATDLEKNGPIEEASPSVEIPESSYSVNESMDISSEIPATQVATESLEIPESDDCAEEKQIASFHEETETFDTEHLEASEIQFADEEANDETEKQGIAQHESAELSSSEHKVDDLLDFKDIQATPAKQKTKIIEDVSVDPLVESEVLSSEEPCAVHSPTHSTASNTKKSLPLPELNGSGTTADHLEDATESKSRESFATFEIPESPYSAPKVDESMDFCSEIPATQAFAEFFDISKSSDRAEEKQVASFHDESETIDTEQLAASEVQFADEEVKDEIEEQDIAQHESAELSSSEHKVDDLLDFEDIQATPAKQKTKIIEDLSSVPLVESEVLLFEEQTAYSIRKSLPLPEFNESGTTADSIEEQAESKSKELFAPFGSPESPHSAKDESSNEIPATPAVLDTPVAESDDAAKEEQISSIQQETEAIDKRHLSSEILIASSDKEDNDETEEQEIAQHEPADISSTNNKVDGLLDFEEAEASPTTENTKDVEDVSVEPLVASKTLSSEASPAHGNVDEIKDETEEPKVDEAPISPVLEAVESAAVVKSTRRNTTKVDYKEMHGGTPSRNVAGPTGTPKHRVTQSLSTPKSLRRNAKALLSEPDMPEVAKPQVQTEKIINEPKELKEPEAFTIEELITDEDKDEPEEPKANEAPISPVLEVVESVTVVRSTRRNATKMDYRQMNDGTPSRVVVESIGTPQRSSRKAKKEFKDKCEAIDDSPASSVLRENEEAKSAVAINPEKAQNQPKETSAVSGSSGSSTSTPAKRSRRAAAPKPTPQTDDIDIAPISRRGIKRVVEDDTEKSDEAEVVPPTRRGRAKIESQSEISSQTSGRSLRANSKVKELKIPKQTVSARTIRQRAKTVEPENTDTESVAAIGEVLTKKNMSRKPAALDLKEENDAKTQPEVAPTRKGRRKAQTAKPADKPTRQPAKQQDRNISVESSEVEDDEEPKPVAPKKGRGKVQTLKQEVKSSRKPAKHQELNTSVEVEGGEESPAEVVPRKGRGRVQTLKTEPELNTSEESVKTEDVKKPKSRSAVTHKLRGKVPTEIPVEPVAEDEGIAKRKRRVKASDSNEATADEPKKKSSRRGGKKLEEPVDDDPVEDTQQIPSKKPRGKKAIPDVDGQDEPAASTPVLAKKPVKKVTIVTPATQSAQLANEKPSRLRKRLHSAVEEEPVAKRPTRSRR